MKHVVISTELLQEALPDNDTIEMVSVQGVDFAVGLIETDDLPFDPEKPGYDEYVLVQKIAFSVNYRDKGILLDNLQSIKAQLEKDENDLSFIGIGSDFVGKVVAIGKQVTNLKVGDRVINNSAYAEHGNSYNQKNTYNGIPSNTASKGQEIFHHSKLLKIPDSISDEVAASLSVGAITAWSMLRKIDVKPGHNILVTSAKSNTSLFMINALRKFEDINVYCLSTSHNHIDRLKSMGVKDCGVYDPSSETSANKDIYSFIQSISSTNGNGQKLVGFNTIVDPLYDIHLHRLFHYLVEGGKYITCGLYEQFSYKPSMSNEIMEAYHRAFLSLILHNKRIIGNCLGEVDDMQHALNDLESRTAEVIIDSVFSEGNVAGFLNRSFNDKGRFGKVVYRF